MIRTRCALVLLLCVPLAGCFEEPVREHLHVTLQGTGPVIVTVLQEVGDPDQARQNPHLADRMEETRSTIENELDPWSNRFEQLQPLAEHQSIERVEGTLRRSIHSAVLSSFDEVVRMIEADGLTGNLQEVGGIAEIRLYPTGGSRASYVQRQQAERLLGEWSEVLAGYFAATINLYTYLESRPDRAVPCLAHVFDKHEGVAGSGPLQREEEELVEKVKESLDEVVMALLVPDDGSYSLNELSRLVYDPFPARLTFAVNGSVLEATGLVPGGGFLERPAIDAWTALIALEGRWLTPDIATTLASPAPEDLLADPDPAEFAMLPRYSATPPTSEEVESALLSALVPESEITLRWRPPPVPAAEPGESSESWLALMANAEGVIID